MKSNGAHTHVQAHTHAHAHSHSQSVARIHDEESGASIESTQRFLLQSNLDLAEQRLQKVNNTLSLSPEKHAQLLQQSDMMLRDREFQQRYPQLYQQQQDMRKRFEAHRAQLMTKESETEHAGGFDLKEERVRSNEEEEEEEKGEEEEEGDHH